MDKKPEYIDCYDEDKDIDEKDVCSSSSLSELDESSSDSGECSDNDSVTPSDDTAGETNDASSRDISEKLLRASKVIGADGSSVNDETIVMGSLLEDVLSIQEDQLLEKMAKDMISLEFDKKFAKCAKSHLDHCSVVPSNSDPSAATQSDESEQWKLLDILYQITVKVSDKSSEFTSKLVEDGMLSSTVEVLGTEQHTNKCSGQLYTEATCWMLEFVGNCYREVNEASTKRELRQVLEKYLHVEAEAVQSKAGQTLLLTTMSDQMQEALHNVFGSEGRSGGDADTGAVERQPISPEEGQLTDRLRSLLSNIVDRMSSSDAVKIKEASHLVDIGMPKVFTENIKAWWVNPSRWLAFNEDGEMWKSLQQWFGTVGTMCKVSETFTAAMAEHGILDTLQSLLNNKSIQEAYDNNGKTKEILGFAISVVFFAARMKKNHKHFRGFHDALRSAVKCYNKSSDANIRGLSLLVLGHLVTFSEEEKQTSTSDLDLEFNTSDCDLFLATYIAYKGEGKVLGDLLARTNFPAFCIQDFREFVAVEEVRQEDAWEKFRHMLASLHLFSDKSSKFVERLVEEGVVEPVKVVLSSAYYRARCADEGIHKMLEVACNLLHHCVRVDSASCKLAFLAPNVWVHALHYATLEDCSSPLRWATFLAFAHIHCYLGALPGNIPAMSAVEFPKLEPVERDVEFLNKLWHMTADREEKTLGDFLAMTGGAAAHAQMLRELVGPPPSESENCNVQRWKESATMDRFKLVLANLNNLAMESEKFAHEICEQGALGVLNEVICSTRLTDIEEFDEVTKTIVDYTASVIHACAMYEKNVPHFRQTNVLSSLARFIRPHKLSNIRRRAFKVAIFMHHYDPHLVAPLIPSLRVSATDEEEQAMYKELYKTDSPSQGQDFIADFLIDIGAVEVSGRALVDLVKRDQLLEQSALVHALQHNMWNYTNKSRRYSQTLHEAGVFHSLQAVITTPKFRDNLQNPVCQDIVSSSLIILYNCAQFEENQPTLQSMRVINDLRRFHSADDPLMQTVAVLATAFLVEEESAHLVRTTSRGGVIRYLLGRLESALCTETLKADGFSAGELLKSLTRLCVSDANKQALVYEGALALLAAMLDVGKPADVLDASRLLWTLGFPDENKHAIREEPRLMERVETLAADHRTPAEARLALHAVMFLVEHTKDRITTLHQEMKQLSLTQAISPELPRIFLSYHASSRPVFRAVEEHLNSLGHLVSTCQSCDRHVTDRFGQMEQAVLRSGLVVMEMAESYQKSLACRTEAYHCAVLGKPVLMVCTKKNFKCSGWLGQFAAQRLRVDVTPAAPPEVIGRAQLNRLSAAVKHIV